ncbi:DUF1778 domain-containing protein [Cupriavidus necator]|uniref:type II toxin-antitoxin system TacA family antitoxin n=1 Tax=Cupriavidus necator TaxID=106590 RepID=UPI00068CC59B|nr:DUF1778 domain-containing protein [Cupriavidus necator]
MATKHEVMTTQDRGRITARLSAENQEVLQLAADLSGSTLNQFIVQAALRAAESVIDHQETLRVIKLTAEQSRRFLSMLDNPPAPNEALQRAMARYRKSKGEDTGNTFEFVPRPQGV